MRTYALPLALSILLFSAGPARAKESGCAKCHADADMEEAARRPALLFAGDAHDRAGLTCVDCHGGNPEETDFLKAHRRSDGFRSRPKEKEVVALCSGCHGDEDRLRSFGVAKPDVSQVEAFRSSVHGRFDPVEGFEIPTCVSCHGAHGLRPPTDPESTVHPSRVPDLCARCHSDLAYMRAFTSARVRVDQLLEYRTSVHGIRLAEGDTKVAVCTSCHGSHDILRASDPNSRVHPLRVETTCGTCHADPEHMAGYTRPGPDGKPRPLGTHQLADYRKSVHREALVEKGDLSAPTCNDCHGNHGATPPEIRVVSHVCRQCHSRPAELYEASELRKHLDETGRPHCATCHGHHDVLRPGATLLDRIAEGATPSGWEPESRWRGVAETFRESLREFEGSLAAADVHVARVEDYGMDLTRARLKLTQARDALIQARVSVHSYDPASLGAILDGTEDEEGGRTLVADASRLADAALEDREFRRYGLVAALGIIAFVIVLLVLKIRRMEAQAA